MEDIPTKNPGDKLTSGEFNSPNDEQKNVVTNSGQALNAGDSGQFTKAAANYTGSADYFLDSGIADAYVINAISPKLAPTAYADGLRVRFIPTNTNTGASTVNLNSLGAQAIKKYGRTVDVEPGDLTAGRVVELAFNQSDDVFELISLDNPIVVESIPLFKSFSGLVLSNNTVTPLTKVDISAGTFKDRDTAAASTLNNTLIKLLDATWVAGDNVGGRASAVALAPDTWYHVFIIAKPDGTTDVGFDTNINAANLLVDAVGFTLFRRRGSVLTDGSSDILQFKMIGDKFIWVNPDLVAITPAAGVIFILFTARAPIDVFTEAQFACHIDSKSPNDIDSFHIRSTFQSSQTGEGAANVYENGFSAFLDSPLSLDMELRTFTKVIVDENSQIEVAASRGAPNIYRISALAYEEIDL